MTLRGPTWRPTALQGPQRLKRQKKLERIAKATGETKAALMESLSDKTRAKLTRKQLRHERSKAKLEKRRRRKAAKVRRLSCHCAVELSQHRSLPRPQSRRCVLVKLLLPRACSTRVASVVLIFLWTQALML